MEMNRPEIAEIEFEERLVALDWPAKTTKGGRTRSVRALMVVGDGQGRVGYGLGKASEVPNAIRKGVAEARKSLMRVPMTGTTITHAVLGRSGAGRVVMKPASEGTGIIAGGAVRAVLELAGVRDVLTKNLGSGNATAMVRAALDALKSLRRVEDIASSRGKSVGEMLGQEVAASGREDG